MPGICRSISATSGRCSTASRTASPPSAATPTTSKPARRGSSAGSPDRTTGWSSATRTRIIAQRQREEDPHVPTPRGPGPTSQRTAELGRPFAHRADARPRTPGAGRRRRRRAPRSAAAPSRPAARRRSSRVEWRTTLVSASVAMRYAASSTAAGSRGSVGADLDAARRRSSRPPVGSPLLGTDAAAPRRGRARRGPATPGRRRSDAPPGCAVRLSLRDLVEPCASCRVRVGSGRPPSRQVGGRVGGQRHAGEQRPETVVQLAPQARRSPPRRGPAVPARP